MKAIFQIIIIFSLIFLSSKQSMAINIIPKFIGGEQQPTALGTGNLVDIFNAAADLWEKIILDNFDITLNYGWAPVGGGTHTLNAQGGNPNRETEGTILFNNDTNPGHHSYYLDPTPYLNEEFYNYEEVKADYGGGLINIQRLYKDQKDVLVENSREDLFSIALHEIQHSLGISNANINFQFESIDGDIDVNMSQLYAGTTIPLARNNFGVTSHIDPSVGATLSASTIYNARVLPSAFDILAVAQLSKFQYLDFDPFDAIVPQPPISKGPRSPRSPKSPTAPVAPNLNSLFAPSPPASPTSPIAPNLPTPPVSPNFPQASLAISTLAFENIDQKISTTVNPEPASILLFGIGLAGAFLRRRQMNGKIKSGTKSETAPYFLIR